MSRILRKFCVENSNNNTLELRQLLTTAIYGQVGTKVTVNSYNVDTQMAKDIATDSNGISTVVWTDGETWKDGLDGSSFGIYARKVDASGNPISSQFRINQRTEGCQTSPVIGLDGAGNAVVAYSNCNYNFYAMYNNFYDYDVRVQRMNADNSRGAEIIIPTPNNNTSDPTPQIRVATDGSFMVAYMDGTNACFRKYGADNTLISSQSGPVGIKPEEGEYDAFSVPAKFKLTPDGTVIAISGVRVKKFIVDVGWKYQDRIAVDKIDANGVIKRDIVFQSGWEDTSESIFIHGSGTVLAIQPMPDGGYIWFHKIQQGNGTLRAEKRDATGAKINGPVTLSTEVSYTTVFTQLPGTSNLLVAYEKFTPWVGSNYQARILDQNANPLSDEFFLLENHSDAPKFAFQPGSSSKFNVTWNDEHPWLPFSYEEKQIDVAKGVPFISFEALTPASTISFPNSGVSINEGTGQATIKVQRTGELRVGGYSVLVSASSPDLPASQFSPFENEIYFGPGESTKDVWFYWSEDKVVRPSQRIILKLTDPKGPAVNLGSNTVFTLNLQDNDGPPEPNVSPKIQPISNKSLNEGEELVVQVLATDSNVPAQILTYSLVSAPSGSTIDSNTGEIRWKSVISNSPAQFQIKVTDNGTPLLSATASFSVTVNPVAGGINLVPTFKPVSNQTVKEGDVLVVQAIATDINVPAQNLTYSFLMAPTGATINPSTGEIRWTAVDTGAPITFDLQVTDNGSPNLTDYTSFTVNVIPKYFGLPARPLSLLPVYSSRLGTTDFQLQFSDNLSLATARNLKNYKFVSAGKDKKFGTRDDKVIPLSSANLLSGDTKYLIFSLKTPALFKEDYRLTITGLKDKAGKLIDGDKNGTVGGTVTAYVRKGITSASIRRSVRI